MSRREQQKEQRRRLILEAGLDAFTSQGFTAARLDSVAEAAGVAKGTIYLYFENKEALFEEVVREALIPAIDEAETLVAEFEGSARDLLGVQLEHFYETMSKPRIAQIMTLLIGEGSRFPKLSEFFFRELITRNQEYMGYIIRRGVASGEFRSTSIDRYTQILVSPAVISAIWSAQLGDISPIDIKEFSRTHIDLVLHGLLA